MLGIMAGMDQEAWFAGFDVVPRAVLVLVSQAPDARHHGRLGPQDSAEVHRCSSWTRFSLCPLLCYECRGPDSALHSLAFPHLHFFTVVVFLLRYSGLFHADHSVFPVAPVHVVDVPGYAGCAVSQVACSSWTR